MTRKRSLREKLEVARAELRGLNRSALVRLPAPDPMYGDMGAREPRFVQLISLKRGYAEVMGALDEAGQVWERHVKLSEKEAGVKQSITDSWWEKVGMDRR